MAHEFPVRAGRAEADVGAAAGEDMGHGKIEGAAGEDLVVGLQHELCHGRRGGDHDRDGAEAQREEGAIAIAEVRHCAVRQASYRMHVPDNRQPKRTRWILPSPIYAQYPP